MCNYEDDFEPEPNDIEVNIQKIFMNLNTIIIRL